MERKEMDKKRRCIPIITLFLLSVLLGGCYYYAGPPPGVVAPPPSPSSYDIVWDNALRAAEEIGIRITSVDNGAGIIYGKRGSTDVKVVVARQNDGRTRVELDMKGQKQETQALANDFFGAYDRYMGR
jgi:hypothetical protein